MKFQEIWSYYPNKKNDMFAMFSPQGANGNIDEDVPVISRSLKGATHSGVPYKFHWAARFQEPNMNHKPITGCLVPNQKGKQGTVSETFTDIHSSKASKYCGIYHWRQLMHLSTCLNFTFLIKRKSQVSTWQWLWKVLDVQLVLFNQVTYVVQSQGQGGSVSKVS